MTLSPQWLDELRARVTLSGIISRTTRLTKAGHEFKACCPFHNEKTPSFTVNDQKGFYHCLAGETRVITRRGRIPIAKLADTNELVLTRGGNWIEAPIRSFGTQRLWRIELSRNRVRKTIHATDGHRWFVRERKDEIKTCQLRPGYRLESVFPQARSDWTLDPAGVRHGIVFGDGTMYKGIYGTINLHGEKDAELARWFPDQEHSHHVRSGGKSYLRIYGGRGFEHMKMLPCEDADEAYLLGFLAGYFAADGHVAKDGTVILNSADGGQLEAVRDIATRLGIGTFGRTTQTRRGLHGRFSEIHRIHFVASALHSEFFLLSEARKRHSRAAKKFERLRWQVISAEPSDRVEEVFCAEVAGEHAFALEDNILTGNCFGCGAHGDVIRWMTDSQGLPFMDAIRELAAEAGMEVPAPDPRAAKVAEQHNTLHQVMAAAQAWFVDRLASAEGEKARAYLATRGFNQRTVERFGFGYAPEGRQALKEALKQFPEELLIEAGLRIVVEDPQSNTRRDPYDRFRGRLMLPIEDARGRVIAFGGRILDAQKTDAPKYLNSPDTPLFDKGRTLYNLHRAGPASRSSGRIVVVEGYMDVIALAAAGIEDAVAPLGTALTERQIELLWRLVETPILCFDGDAAGQRAAMRAVTRALPLLRPAHSLKIARLPAGLDPDDLIKRDGAKAMESLLASPRSLIEVLWEHERDAAPLATPEDKAGLKARLMAHVETIADRDIQALYRRELNDRFSAFAYPPREQREWRAGARPATPQRANRETVARARRGGNRDGFAAAVLAGLLRFPQELARHAETLAHAGLPDPRFEVLADALDAGEVLESARLATILAERGLAAPEAQEYAALRFGFLAEDAPEAQARAELAQAVGLLVERPALEAALAEATRRFERDLSDGGAIEASWAEQQRLLKRKLEFDARLRQMAGARGTAPSGAATQ